MHETREVRIGAAGQVRIAAAADERRQQHERERQPVDADAITDRGKLLSKYPRVCAVAMVIGADPAKGIVIFQYSQAIDRVSGEPA